MSDLPSEIIREILLRSPAESLFRFRAVCKAWCSVIDDPSFIKSHTNNQLSSNTLLIRNETAASLYFLNLDSLNFTDGLQTIRVTPLQPLVRCGALCPTSLPVAACNGLILIAHEGIKTMPWAIWNPLTRERLELPQLNNKGLNVVGGGLGYDYAADDYKVAMREKLRPDGVSVCQTHVYSLKSNSWRMIGDCPCDFQSLRNPGVFLNGALHWRSRDIIIAFDLGTESYRQLPLPPLEPGLYRMHLDALGGCLIVCHQSCKTKHFDGWVMNDYGAEDSWMKLFSFREPDIIYPAATEPRLVAYLKSKKQVFLQRDSGFFWFDIESNSVKKVSIHGLSGICSSQICPGSLIRLHDSCGVRGSVAAKRRVNKKRKTRRKMKMADTEPTFCVRDSGVRFCSHDSCSSSDSSASSESEY